MIPLITSWAPLSTHTRCCIRVLTARRKSSVWTHAPSEPGAMWAGTQGASCSCSLMWTENPAWKYSLCSLCLKTRHVGPGKWQNKEHCPATANSSALARQQDMVPSSFAHPPYHVSCPAVCVLAGSAYFCCTVWSVLSCLDLATESLYICPRQLKISSREMLSLETSLLSSPKPAAFTRGRASPLGPSSCLYSNGTALVLPLNWGSR